jgi:2-amino-4-hydroxy-6-hydroxymethyldihydropteridine diphosphokinase
LHAVLPFLVFVSAAIALGSNLGDRHAHIQFALDQLHRLAQTRLTAHSTILETAPVGPVDQGPYLNAAALVETTLSARDLLDALLSVERLRGRDRSLEQRWGPRTLDLDLLLYGGQTISEPGLTIPHPRLHERLFVLEPLAQIAPDLVVPGLNKSVVVLFNQALAATRNVPSD